MNESSFDRELAICDNCERRCNPDSCQYVEDLQYELNESHKYFHSLVAMLFKDKEEASKK